MSDPRKLLGPELAALASALAPLDEEGWSSASLCDGWTVGNVVAHLTMAARYDEQRFGAELAEDGFDFQATSDRIAHRDGDLPREQLLADLRSESLATFEQPGGGWAGSVSHAVIHGVDVTLPLGLGRVAGDDATRLVLDALVAPATARFSVSSSVDAASRPPTWRGPTGQGTLCGHRPASWSPC